MKNAPVNATEIFAKNLINLRRMQGLSQSELADKTELSRQTVMKYERGETDPSIATITKLSKALKVPFDYFFKENLEVDFHGLRILDCSGSFDKVRFREGEKLDDYTEDSVKKVAFEKLLKLIDLEKIMESQIKFKNPIKHLQNISTKEQAEEAALEVRKKWGLYDNPFANVISVLERKGIRVIEVEASPNFEGLSASYFDLPIIVLNNSIDEVTRKRFTALHELGHLILQIPETINYEVVERICDAFASMLILPKELLILELGESRTTLNLNELNLIKQKYGISIRAILVSAGFAKIISWTKYKEICQTLEENPNEIAKYSGNEVATRFEQLLYKGVMEKRIDQKIFSELTGDNESFHELKAI